MPSSCTLFYFTQPLQADCMAYSLPNQVKAPGGHVVFSGRATTIEQISRNPDVELVTFLVDCVWKGNVGPMFEAYNVPTDWTRRAAPSSRVASDGFVSINVPGIAAGQSIARFELDGPWVIVADPLTALEREELGFADNQERFSTALCRNGRKSVAHVESNGEINLMGPSLQARVSGFVIAIITKDFRSCTRLLPFD